MLQKIGRLFVIKNRFEASMIVYALALGAMERGLNYQAQIPGWGGWLMVAACCGSVMMAGAKMFDCIRLEAEVAALRAQIEG